MGATARRTADCLFGGLLLLLLLDPPGVAAIPLCAGLAWLFAWMVALPLSGSHRLWPAGAVGATLTLALVVASQPWALPTGWPVWLAALAAGAAAAWAKDSAPTWLGVGILGGALLADQILLKGLYPSLHLALVVLAVAAAAAVLHRTIRRPMAGSFALHVAGAACLVAAFLPAAASPEARRALRGQSSVGSKLLLVAWAASDLDADGRSHLFGGGDPDPLTPSPQFRATQDPPARSTPPMTPRPVLIISADSLRADSVSAYRLWAPAQTPHIDGLARDGWLFERAYAEVPATVPSFQATLAGGVCGPARAVLPERANLRPTFEAAGFRVTETEDLTLARDAVSALNAEGGVTWIHLWTPHAPYPPPGDEPRTRYENGVRQFDEAVGALVEEVPSDTAIVVTSDHGEAFGRHGASYHRTSVYDEQVRVPLIIRPGQGFAPRTVPGPVGLRSLGSTIRHLRGCIGSAGGASLLAPTAADTLAPPIHLRTLRLEGAFGPPASMRGVVRGRWKLVHRVDWNLSELYDLEVDPLETQDLAAERPGLVEELLALP